MNTSKPFSVNELHVQRAQGIANEEVEVQLTVNNMEPLVGMQCTFSLPQQLVYVDGSFTTTERTTGCSAFASLNGQQLTLYLFNPTNQPWTGDDGVVATFKLLLDGRSGSYRLNPSNVILSNVTEENMTSATSGNYVIIQSPIIKKNDRFIEELEEKANHYKAKENEGRQLDRAIALIKAHIPAMQTAQANIRCRLLQQPH